MWHQFTAAAGRALVYASGWSNRTGCAELEAEPLLVGLLWEPECRAATMLARLAIDIPGGPPAMARAYAERSPAATG